LRRAAGGVFFRFVGQPCHKFASEWISVRDASGLAITTLRLSDFLSVALTSNPVSTRDPCFAAIKKDHAFEFGCGRSQL
jgi:hypothetical protein